MIKNRKQKVYLLLFTFFYYLFYEYMKLFELFYEKEIALVLIAKKPYVVPFIL